MDNILYVLAMVGFYRIAIYAIGDPHAEYNPRAIWAGYTAWIASLRLRHLGINVDQKRHFLNGVQRIDEVYSHRSYLYSSMQGYEGWTSVVGMCSTCTSVWFFALLVLAVKKSFILYGLSLLISKITFKWS